jgi:hypothetical protein
MKRAFAGTTRLTRNGWPTSRTKAVVSADGNRRPPAADGGAGHARREGTRAGEPLASPSRSVLSGGTQVAITRDGQRALVSLPATATNTDIPLTVIVNWDQAIRREVRVGEPRTARGVPIGVMYKLATTHDDRSGAHYPAAS